MILFGIVVAGAVATAPHAQCPLCPDLVAVGPLLVVFRLQ